MSILVGRVLLGPLFHLRSSPPRAAAGLIVAVLLTVLTQVGGVVLWAALPLLELLCRKARRLGRWPAWSAAIAGYSVAYAVVAFAATPPLAALFGRQALPCFASADRPVAAASMLFCAANRHYAKPEVHRLLARVGRDLAARFPGSVVSYLDAGFPFLDGFPLLPHLSHRSGKIVDLAFFYRDVARGERMPRAGGWPAGYWVFAPSRPGEPQPCPKNPTGPTLRWDMTWLQPLFSEIRLDETRTRAMLEILVREARAGTVERILLEPYLRARWRLPSRVVRFQGCRAARHDDHVHVRLK